MALHSFTATLFLLFTHAITAAVAGESSTCLTVYEEGGAPAVFQSPKCPRWKLSSYGSPPRSPAAGARCQVAMLKGRRKYQEDRTFCALDIRIPFPANTGLKEVTVGIVAVFDGHNGAEASDMASKLLFEYFMVHTYFLLDSTFSVTLKKFMGKLGSKGELDAVFEVLNSHEDLSWQELDQERVKSSRTLSLGHSDHLEVLKEALLRAIQDIDLKFSKEASRRSLNSGSTATVILMADGKMLVANVGDSKALLCSEKFQSPADARATLLRLYREKRRNGAIIPVRKNEDFKLASLNGLTHFSTQELTRDHSPERDDERSRVEAAGGYVLRLNGVSRVNGQLAVSRAIGDVKFKSSGVIASPEVMDWKSVNINDSYLVAASDGVFEELSPQDVCDVLWEAQRHDNSRSEISSSCSYSLADCIVETAFEKGSTDNMAAVVVPLQSSLLSHNFQENSYTGEADTDVGSEYFYKQSGKGLPSEIVHMEHAHPLSTKFDRLMVEPKHGGFCCFYLAEPLSEHGDDMTEAPVQDRTEPIHGLPLALPEALNQHCGGSLSVYTDQSSCMYFGMADEQMEGQCRNSEGFARVLALLESISFHDSSSNYGTFEHGIPDNRYILKKRFGRGSYGEVWLAVHWNCCQGSYSSRAEEKINSSYSNNIRSDSSLRNSLHGSCIDNCSSGADANLFILKRLMVERGRAVYLSGLREKYFGEVFLNASSSLGDQLSARQNYSFFKKSRSNFEDKLDINGSATHDIYNRKNFGSNYTSNFGQMTSHEEGLDHIARYVESFESQSSEVWLVFRHEGVSLSKLIYTTEQIGDKDEGPEQAKHSQVLYPSKWWKWLKTTKAGEEEMRNLIWQLLLALKFCHDRNITHRDIKPENMVVCFEDKKTGGCLRESPSEEKKYTTKMRIIDFGSALDEFTLKNLYGSSGPSRAEQTSEYAPPEALLNSTWYRGPTGISLKYDMWSVGVVILELVLGSPNVFQLSPLTTALLDQHLEGWDESLKELAYRLRSFMEFCILIPGSSSKHRFGATIHGNGVSPASWKCSEEFFARQIKSRDPLKLGFPDVSVLRLVRHLLQWDPDDRLSVDEAMQHPYFESLARR